MDVVELTLGVVGSIIATPVIFAVVGAISTAFESVTQTEVTNPLLDTLTLYFSLPTAIIGLTSIIIGVLVFFARRT